MPQGLSVRYLLLSLFILLFLSNSLFSLSSYDVIPSKKAIIISQLHPVFIFTTGASISQLGRSQSFTPLDLCSYNYKPTGSNTTNVLWGGFVGSEVKHSSSWGLIAGFGYYQPSFLSTKGRLTQGADAASSDTYNYRYRTLSQQLLAEAKLYWVTKEKIHSFLMLGIGSTFNNTFNYQTNVPPFLEFTQAFSNHKQTNFTYAIGPGIDISVSKSFRIGVAYRFTDLGSANTGSAHIDAIPISSTLKQSHLYANQILAQFTFIPWPRD